MRPDDEAIAREMVKHENELTNQRMTWLLTLQGLLFAALSFAWEKSLALVIVLAVVGSVTAFSTSIVLASAQKAHERLRQWWAAHKPADYDGPGIHGYWKEGGRVHWFLLPWHCLPWLLMAAWVSVAILNASASTVAP